MRLVAVPSISPLPFEDSVVSKESTHPYSQQLTLNSVFEDWVRTPTMAGFVTD